MLNFKNIALRRGARVLFANSTFTIHKGQKAGFTGANGAGKSSLFALVKKELHLDEGDFSMPPHLEIAHVAQETPAVSSSAIDYVIDGDQELRRLQAQLLLAESSDNGIKQAELHAALENIGGYTAQARASRLMNGLGFTADQEHNAVNSFSGGWRMRLNLAQALMCRSDVLLLDEPTNHLDLDAVIWLQDWLCKYPGTLLLISHDRDFLDTITDHIVHIEQNKAEIYTGNYSAFERMRAEKLSQQQSAYQKQQREIAHIQSFVDRFKAQATKARQAQSRIKALERMEMISAAHIDSQFNFEFRSLIAAPDPLLVLDNMQVGYNSTPLIKDIALAIRPGERLGLLGRNGAGKTTLIKLLANELKPLSGKRVEGKDLNIGYFAQHQLEQLRPDESPLQHMLKLDPLTREQEHMNFLGGFDFKGEMARSPCANFSGGEKSRLALALLIWTRPNLLLLDEPTNHLDLEMRHALTLALQDYEGGVILVSHDRALLRATCDEFILVADGKAEAFDGDLEDYSLWLTAQRLKDKQSAQMDVPERLNKNDRALNKAEKQARILERRPLIKELELLELNIERWHGEKKTCDERLNDAELYAGSDKTELQQLLKKQAELANQIEVAEERWLELHELLDAIPVFD